ncbi:putative retrotransposon gag domain-containing protein [Helianthus annuus]|nr:putative retrotransposon gag domain-containing protein [Helianthus annuus]
MDTRSSSELKKILETFEADKKNMADQMKALQDQVRELVVLQRRSHDDARSDAGTEIHTNRDSGGGWHSNDIKVDIPEYDGKLDPDEFVEWIHTVERVFDYKQTSEEHKVKIVALKLRKYASTWWSNVCSKRERAGKDKIRSWPKMKTKMKQKFLPTYYLQIDLWRMDGDGDWTKVVAYWGTIDFAHILYQQPLHLMADGNWLLLYQYCLYKTYPEKVYNCACTYTTTRYKYRYLDLGITPLGKYLETLVSPNQYMK